MKKKIFAVLLTATLALTMVACGNSNGTKKGNGASAETTYQSIFDEYSLMIKDATPKLVEEYNTEAQEKAGDVTALAELSTEKVNELAEISVEGTEKMAELKLKNGDSDETYTEWAEKLNEVYMEYSKQITDAYTSSAM